MSEVPGPDREERQGVQATCRRFASGAPHAATSQVSRKAVPRPLSSPRQIISGPHNTRWSENDKCPVDVRRTATAPMDEVGTKGPRLDQTHGRGGTNVKYMLSYPEYFCLTFYFDIISRLQKNFKKCTKDSHVFFTPQMLSLIHISEPTRPKR